MLPETSKKGKKRKAASNDRLKDFGVEYAKSGRSTCAGCGSMVTKGEIRVIYINHESEVGVRFGGQAISHHVTCFNEIRGDYNYFLGGADLPGYSELSKEDRQILKDSIK